MPEPRDAGRRERFVAHVDAELQGLIPGYLENRRRDIQSLREALEQGDYETARLLGHRMKGTGGGYGFHAITDIGRSLEQAADTRDPARIRALVDELSTYLERVEVVYE